MMDLLPGKRKKARIRRGGCRPAFLARVPLLILLLDRADADEAAVPAPVTEFDHTGQFGK